MPTNPFNIGLGIRKYQPDNEPVKTCNEMILPGCDCCRIGPCKLCLKWTVDGVEENGKATGDGELWEGSAGGIGFKAYWDETYCTINVELNGELVWVRGLCEGYGGDEVTCRDWSGSVEYALYGGPTGIFEWKITEYLQLKRRNGDPPEDSCRVDVMIVFDSQEANRPAVQDIQNNAMQSLVDLLESYSGSYRLGLITFRAGERTVTLDEPMSLNNGDAFLAAVNSISVAGNDVDPPSNVRPSFHAMTLAEAQDWRPSAHRVCILVNQGAPGADDVDQYQVVSSMAISGVKTHTITTPYWSAPGPSPTHAFNEDSQEKNSTTALFGGGSHSSVISDGIFDFNDGVTPLPDAIESLVSDLCNPLGEKNCFARSFCGDCDCAPEELCVTVLNDTHSCVGIIPFTGERCPDGTVIGPRWEGDVECNPGEDSVHVTVSLSRNEYDDSCVISGTAVGTINEVEVSIDLVPKAVGDCKALSGSWAKEIDGEPYTVSIRPLDCGECSGQPCPDCECGLEHPAIGTIYLTVIPRSNCCGNIAGVHAFVFIGYVTNSLGECELEFQGTVDGETFIYSCQGGLFSNVVRGQPDLFLPPSLEADSTCDPFFLHWVLPSPEAFYGRCDPACIDEEEAPSDVYLTI
jgi:hypothetical protein